MRSISVTEKRAELRRILKSQHFARARKKSRFLEFICEQSFQGHPEQTSEYQVGVEVYQRGEGFNPHEDSIVRVQAHEIRKSLKEFYSDEGRQSSIRLDLPPGHYVPQFTRVPNGASPSAESEVPPSGKMASRAPWALAVCLALLSAGLGFLLLREEAKKTETVSVPWSAEYPAEIDWFWEPFLPPASPPLVVVPVHPLLRAVHDGDSEKTRNRGFEIDKEQLPEFRDTIHYRELKTFRFVPSTTDFTAVGETLGLIRLFELFSSRRQAVHMEAARLVDLGEVERNNTILLGGNQAWSGRIFLYREGFWFHRGLITNSKPDKGEKEVYQAKFDPLTNDLRKDYALILMLPSEKEANRILLLYGIYTQGSQAAIEFVTSQDGLRELRQALVAKSSDGKVVPTYFQALLETTVENSVPGKTSIVAVRIIPDKRGS